MPQTRAEQLVEVDTAVSDALHGLSIDDACLVLGTVIGKMVFGVTQIKGPAAGSQCWWHLVKSTEAAVNGLLRFAASQPVDKSQVN